MGVDREGAVEMEEVVEVTWGRLKGEVSEPAGLRLRLRELRPLRAWR